MNRQRITRRTFVRTAATVSMLAAVGATLPACAAKQNDGADAQGGEGKGGAAVDFVIVGGGIGGLSAAIRAAELGASVIVLEKEATLGGDSAISSGTIHAPGTKLQAQQGFPNDTIDAYIEDIRLDDPAYTEQGEPLCHALFEGAANMVDFLCDQGVEFLPLDESDMRAHNVDGGGGALMEVIKQLADSDSISVLTKTAATSLVVEDGRVVGVSTETGETYRGERGVVLATGGFCNNPALIGEYAPEFSDIRVVSSAGAEGDGLIMAQDVDASTFALDAGVHTYFVSVEGVADMSWQGGVSPAIVVNVNGERFMAEDCHYDTAGKLGVKQPEHRAYFVFDERARTESGAFEDNFESGIVTEAESIDELATLIGTPALAETVSRYNEMLQTESADADFGRTACLEPLEQGPYYAIEIEPCIYYSYGGVEIDADARVIGADGKPIDGLYACGEVCVSSEVREGLLYSSGLSQGYVFGRKAIETALEA